MPKTLTLIRPSRVIPVDLVRVEMRCRLAEWRHRPVSARLPETVGEGSLRDAPDHFDRGSPSGGGVHSPPDGAFSPLRAVGYIFVVAKAAILSKTGFVLVPSEP